VPVRRSKLNYQSVGGILASTRLGRAVRFDSLLERDFLLILDLHPAVEWFEEQPMKIPWIDASGDERIYVPDVFVKFHRGRQFLGRIAGTPLVVELKHRDDLGKQWETLRPKLRAGFHASAQQGYRFKILTERQTRGIALRNAEFVRKHLHGALDEDEGKAIISAVRRTGQSSAEELAASLKRIGRTTPEPLDYVWTLVARGYLAVDLETSISPCSMITMGWRDAKR
jgi:hypothetical protein